MGNIVWLQPCEFLLIREVGARLTNTTHCDKISTCKSSNTLFPKVCGLLKPIKGYAAEKLNPNLFLRGGKMIWNFVTRNPYSWWSGNLTPHSIWQKEVFSTNLILNRCNTSINAKQLNLKYTAPEFTSVTKCTAINWNYIFFSWIICLISKCIACLSTRSNNVSTALSLNPLFVEF